MNTTRIAGSVGTGTIRRPSHSARRVAALPALAVVAALAVTGCGSDEKADTAADAQSQGTDQQGVQQGDRRGDRQARFPGVFGKVATVSGDVAQVQGSDGQTAVTLTGATVTTTQEATLSDLTLGRCVTVSFGSSDASSETSSDTSTPATTVAISDPEDGECSSFGGRGMGGGSQGAPGGQRAERPEGAPTGRPSGAPSGAPQGGPPGGDRVTGKVTAVSPSGFTVDAVTMPAPPQGQSGSSAPAEPKTTTESRDVPIDDGTTFSRAVEGSTFDVTEGRCVMATGEQDESGGLTAETVSVSDAADGECSMGMGIGMGGGRR